MKIELNRCHKLYIDGNLPIVTKQGNEITCQSFVPRDGGDGTNIEMVW